MSVFDMDSSNSLGASGSKPPLAVPVSRLANLPDILLRQENFPTDRSPRLLTSVYGALRSSFSGSTWHYAKAGIAEGTLEGAFTLNSENRFNPVLALTGGLWKLQRRMRGRTHGGFKFVPAFHDILWSRYIEQLAGTTIINNTQIYGDLFLKRFSKLDITPCFFIDGTLTEYFYGYGAVRDRAIDEDIATRAITMELESYKQAACIIAMSRATARNLVEVYRVPPARVAVVLPGANINDQAVPPPSLHKGWVGDQFTLGFVGLFPQRKGLDKIAQAVRLLRSRGAPIRLRVIGKCPDAIAAMEGVEFLGTIDKTHDTERFIAALRSVDLGCQISHAELIGIAMLEFLRLGVPVIAIAIGGMPDVLNDGGGVLVPVDITPEQLAVESGTLMSDQARYGTVREAAVRRSEWASWRRAAREIDAVLGTKP